MKCLFVLIVLRNFMRICCLSFVFYLSLHLFKQVSQSIEVAGIYL